MRSVTWVASSSQRRSQIGIELVLGPREELFVIPGSVEEASGVFVAERIHHALGHLGRFIQPAPLSDRNRTGPWTARRAFRDPWKCRRSLRRLCRRTHPPCARSPGSLHPASAALRSESNWSLDRAKSFS